MANLLDTIRSNQNQIPQQGMEDTGAGLQTLLRAKSGKASAGPGVVASSLGEQQAVQDTNTTLQNQVAPQAAAQGIAQEQQQQQTQQQIQGQTQQIQQQSKFDNLQNKLQINQTLSDLERNKGQIDVNRDKAQLEQVGFQLRLSNNQYIDNLQREGQKARLDNQVNFDQQLQANALGNNQALLEKQLGNQSVLNANSRDFNKAMAQMDVNTAYDMFKNQMATDKQRALWTSIGALGGAGAGAYGAYDKSQTDEANT